MNFFNLIYLFILIINLTSNLIDCAIDKDSQVIIQPIHVPSNLVEKRKVILNCQIIQGKQPIAFEWQFNGHNIISNDNLFYATNDEDLSVLTIKSLNFDLIGNYSCIAKSGPSINTNTVHIKFNCKSLYFYYQRYYL